MIGRLVGTLAGFDDGLALIDVNGVGYDVSIPERVGSKLTVGQSITLYIHTAFQQEEQSLYGFETKDDRYVFRKLLSVSRLGPKVASALLSSLNARQIATAISGQNPTQLAAVKGVGKKTSESIVFALRDAVSGWELVDSSPTDESTPFVSSSVSEQAIAALRQLGFQRSEAERAVSRAFEADIELGELTRRSLELIGNVV